MKRQQKFITTLSLIVALSGLSPVMAAVDGGELGSSVQGQSGQSRKTVLSTAKLDSIHAGQSAREYACEGACRVAWELTRPIGSAVKAYACSQGIQSAC